MKKTLLPFLLMSSTSLFAQQSGLTCNTALPLVRQYIQIAQDNIDQAQKTDKNNKEILLGHANYFAAQALLKFACPQYTKAIDTLEESIQLIEKAVEQP